MVPLDSLLREFVDIHYQERVRGEGTEMLSSPCWQRTSFQRETGRLELSMEQAEEAKRQLLFR